MNWIVTLTYENDKSRWIVLCLETGVYFTRAPGDTDKAILLHVPGQEPFKVMANYDRLRKMVKAGEFEPIGPLAAVKAEPKPKRKKKK